MLVSIDDIKSYLGIEDEDILLETWFSDVQASVVSQISDYIQQPLELQATEYFFEGDGYTNKYLPFNLISVAVEDALEVRETPLNIFEIVDNDIWALTSKGNIPVLYNSGCFTLASEYKLTATVGWETADLPGAIKQVIIEMIAIIYNESMKKGNLVLGVSSIAESSIGENRTTTYIDLWKRKWKPILKKYRIPTT